MRFVFLISIIIVLLGSAVLLATCKKEYSYEGGPKAGTAVYTLSGAGSDCSGAVVSGNYYTATSLLPSNTVELEVHVTTAGTYTLNTTTTDGFHFTSSGSFADTGTQTVVLTATGTPTLEGNFSFSALAAIACTFTVTVQKAPVIMAEYTLAGAPNVCQDFAVRGQYIAGTAMTTANTAEVYVNVTSVGAYILKTDTLDGIYYSASGTFSATGLQKVIMNASGTPTDPRNLTFTPKVNASNCTFTVTVINPEPLATYVLESGSGNPNPCIYVVNGAYSAGTALSASNTVRINVYVTVVGNFTIATNTVDGIQFAYTGTFTTTGAQVVFLNGTGTPSAIGTFTFTPQIVGPHPLGGQACAFDIPVK